MAPVVASALLNIFTCGPDRPAHAQARAVGLPAKVKLMLETC